MLPESTGFQCGVRTWGRPLPATENSSLMLTFFCNSSLPTCPMCQGSRQSMHNTTRTQFPWTAVCPLPDAKRCSSRKPLAKQRHAPSSNLGRSAGFLRQTPHLSRTSMLNNFGLVIGLQSYGALISRSAAFEWRKNVCDWSATHCRRDDFPTGVPTSSHDTVPISSARLENGV